MNRKIVTAALALCAAAFAAPAIASETDVKHPEPIQWSFEGPFGHYDRAALQRGYQVYKEVCAVCHSMELLAFRNLGDHGGPEFSEAEVKALAAGYQVADTDDIGEPITRAGLPSDYFPSPYANEKAGRGANGGAYPPDLSVMAKARMGGAAYIRSLVGLGYGAQPPADMHMNPGMSYNPYFPGGQIAMPAPLVDGQVTYADGTPATVIQMATDVSHFLMWTAEPKLEERKELGFKVMAFLAVFALLLFFVYRRVWRDVEH